MDLLKAVEAESLEEIKQLLSTQRTEIDAQWLDYAALNKSLECEKKNVTKLLLESNCRVNMTNATNCSTNTPLHNAVLLEDIDLVNSILNKKASIVAVNSKGSTPLHLAFTHRQQKLVDFMLTYLKSTSNYKNPRNKIGLTHLHIACARNNSDVVKGFLTAGIDAKETLRKDSPFWSGYNAMHIAVICGALDVVRVLDQSKQFSKWQVIKERNGYTAHDLAQQKANKFAVITHILEDFHAPAVPDFIQTMVTEYVGAYDYVPKYIHFACLQDDAATLEEFMKNSSVVNSPIIKTSPFIPLYTPLHLAVESQFENNVKVLLKYGAKVDFKNGYNMTPLHLALYNEARLPEKRTQIVDLLYAALKKKEENITDNNGLSYFHVAISRNDLPMVKKYLNKGANVNSVVKYNLRQFSNFTPLHFAVKYRCTEIVKLLIERGANVDKDDNGKCGTPLHLAIESNDKSLISLLLENGADAKSVRASDKMTVLHILANNYISRRENTSGPLPMNEFFALKFGPKAPLPLLNYVKRFYELGVDVNAKDSNGNTALHLACSEFTDGAECAKRLINRGADINLENNDGETAFDLIFIVDHDDPYDCAMLYHHVQRLKALGLNVNPKNMKCCQKLLKDCCKFDEFKKVNLEARQKQRLDELKKMKGVKLNENLSLYQFVLMNSSQLTQYAENEILKQIIEAKSFKKDYPSYGYLIKLQCRRAKGAEAQ